MKKYFLPTLMALALVLGSCEKNENDSSPEPASSLLDKVSATGNYNLFLVALDSAELSGSLEGSANVPLVLIPTDAAFQRYLNQLGYADLNALLASEGKAYLQALLRYLMVDDYQSANGYFSSRLPADYDSSLLMSLHLSNTSSNFKANGVSAIGAINGANGTAYTFDSVLRPLNIAQLAELDGNHSSFATAAKLAQNRPWSVLEQETPKKTAFIPNNVGFQKLIDQQNNVNDLLGLVTAWGQDSVEKLVLYHIADGLYPLASTGSQNINTLCLDQMGNAQSVFLNRNSSGNSLVDFNPNSDNALIISEDIVAKNGIFNTINEVLLPK